MITMSGSPCPHYDCSNRNSFGYCKTTVCINEDYQQEQWGLQSTTNKSEYIERGQARQVICGWCEYDKEWLDRYIKEHDARIKTIKDYHDYQPVVHGHWIVRRGNYNEEFECSKCQNISKDGGNYCSNCGARMEG